MLRKMVFPYNNNIFTYFKAVTLVAVFFLTLLLQNPLSILMDHFLLQKDSYCTVRSIRYNKDNELLQKYKPLHDYSFFVYDVEKRVASGDSLANAIRSATDYCINHNIMRDYLSANYEEVFEMMSLRWNEKDAKKYWQKEAREEGHAAGLAEGHAQDLSQGLVKGRMSATIAFIKNLISMRMPYSDIAKATNTSIEEVQRIAKENGLSL